MIETENFRIATLAAAENDKANLTKNKIILNIVYTLPIVSISDELLTNNTIAENSNTSTRAIGSWSYVDTTITVNVAVDHGYVLGETVNVTNLLTDGTNPILDNDVVITEIIDSNTFTFTTPNGIPTGTASVDDGSLTTSYGMLGSKNTLVDEVWLNSEGSERFTYITTATSVISKNKVRFYHDAKYEDIIVLPEIAYISQNIDTKPYELRGYRIGGGRNIDAINNDYVIPTDEKFLLPTTNSNINCTTKHLSLHGVNIHNDNSIRTAIGDAYISDKRLLPLAMIGLGGILDLFPESIRIPTYTLYQATPDRYSLKYVNMITPENIYIPLNF